MATPRPDSFAAECRRKLVHLSLLLLVPLGRWAGEDVPWVFAAALLMSCLVDGMRRTEGSAARAFDRVFGASLRPGEARGLLGSTPWLVTTLICALLLPWPRVEVVVVTTLVGDAAAALTGRAWKAWRPTPGGGRTLLGSGAYLALAAVSGLVWGLPPAAALALGTLLAAVERLAGALHVDDNWLGPPFAGALLSLLLLP